MLGHRCRVASADYPLLSPNINLTKKNRNCDIKNLTRGCRVWLPTFVEGANLSMGDMHFSQGDGEVSFCGAIEMSGFLELR